MATLIPEPTNAFGIQQPALTPLYAPPRGTAPAPAAPTAPAAPSVSWLPGKGPQQSPYSAPLAAGLGGIQAGQVGSQAYDVKSGAVATLGAAATGATTGFLVGGPLGAAVGGVAGGALGALNAWMSVGKENKANRDRQRLLAEAKAEQQNRDRIARNDAVDGLAYERRAVEESKREEEWKRNLSLIGTARAKSKARQEEYLNRGFTT